jgi:hypothetical protein
MCISYFVVPYDIAFQGPKNRFMHNLDLFLDVVILIDVLLNFITDSYSDGGTKLNNRQIAFKYIKSYFLIDLMSCMPMLVTNEKYIGTHWIYCLKLLRLFKIQRIFKQVEDLFKEMGGIFKEHTSFNIRFTLSTLFWFFYLFHFIACTWIILGKCNDENNLIFCGLPTGDPL